jgi:gluconolactonase
MFRPSQRLGGARVSMETFIRFWRARHSIVPATVYCTDHSVWTAYSRSHRTASFHLVAEYDGEPNGLKIHKDGRIFIADHRKGLLLLDPAKRRRNNGACQRQFRKRFAVWNDLVFARKR